MEVIYADHAATTPVHPLVAEEMLPFFTTYYGNPSSIHQVGRQARQALEKARSTIAGVLSASERSLVFTSGGTEAANLAILGYALEHKHLGNHIITTQIEHHAVLHACEELERLGFDVTYLPVDSLGRIHPEDVQEALRDETILVTCMFGNNEVGTLQPIMEIGAVLRGHQAVFHTDAVQACGAVRLDVDSLPVDMLSICAHKINGPKGIGLLYVKEGITLHPISYGGEQERKRRAGTENVAAIAGFAKALELIDASYEDRRKREALYRQILIDTLTKAEVSFHINGHPEHRLPHIVNISFTKTTIESLLTNFDLAGIAVSSGSACTAGTTRPSHVLVSMFGEESDRVSSAVRFSFGLGNTPSQIEELAEKTVKIVKRLEQQEGFIR